jgi:endonuclease G, mitochondrial
VRRIAIKRLLLLLAGLCLPLPAGARTQPANCAVNIADGVRPAVDAKHAVQSRLLCFHGFAVHYSGLTKTPLWSAEHLTPDRIQAADALPREGKFHAEPRLPVRMRTTGTVASLGV